MHCDHCGDELPPDARFCIDCGASLVMTGPTMQLDELICSDCYARNPEDAWNCGNCGRRLAIDSIPPYQPAPAIDNSGANRAGANGLGLGDLLLALIDLLTDL